MFRHSSQIIPTREILEKGFNTGYGTINKPKRIETAAELSCILLFMMLPRSFNAKVSRYHAPIIPFVGIKVLINHCDLWA